MFKQECLPVGCVPSTAVAVSQGGVCSGGVSAPRGVSAPGGGGVLWSWVSALEGSAPGWVCSGGVSWSQGGFFSGEGGVCSQGGVCSVGVCVCSRGGPLPGGCLLRGGVCSGGCVCSSGVSAPWGVGIPPCTEADTPSPCGQTDACKNITFATSLQTVNMLTKKNQKKNQTLSLRLVWNSSRVLSGWCNRIAHGYLVAHPGLLLRGCPL